MSALKKLDRPVRLSLRVLAVLAFVPPLLTRFLMGHAFYLAGRGKLANPPVEFFSKLGIPLPEWNAVFVANLEYYGGLLLVVGLLTRIVAGLLSSTMVVALLTAHKEELLDALRGVGDAGPMDIAPVAYLALLLWLVFWGPGALSLDTLVLRRWRPDGTKPATSK
jgi:putative oxidoreductase